MRVGFYAGNLADGTLAKQAGWAQTFLNRALELTVSNSLTSKDWEATFSSHKWTLSRFRNFPAIQCIYGMQMVPIGAPLIGGYPWTIETGAHFFAESGVKAKFNDLATIYLNALYPWEFPEIHIRIGWEFNYGLQPWNAIGGAGTDREKAYAQYFRNIVNTFRARQVAGQRFVFHWCPGITAWPKCDIYACYPGNDYVDVIGADAYQQEGMEVDENRAWELMFNGVASGGGFGLRSLLNFAAKNGKPFMLQECGGKTPAYFERIRGLHVDFSVWHQNSGGYDGRLDAPERPDVAPRFKELFGSF